MISLVELPTSTALLSGIGEYASPFFTELLPFGLLILGVFIGVFILRLVVDFIIGIFYSWLHKTEEEKFYDWYRKMK